MVGTVLGVWYTKMNSEKSPCPEGVYEDHLFFHSVNIYGLCPHVSDNVQSAGNTAMIKIKSLSTKNSSSKRTESKQL